MNLAWDQADFSGYGSIRCRCSCRKGSQASLTNSDSFEIKKDSGSHFFETREIRKPACHSGIGITQKFMTISQHHLGEGLMACCSPSISIKL